MRTLVRVADGTAGAPTRGSRVRAPSLTCGAAGRLAATAGQIVPRWELPTFGAAGAPLAALAPERVEDSDEVYVVSQHADASVKVRAGLVDVKQLEAVDERGLEQWRPVMKATFPLTAADAALALQRLGVPA